jgi:hypothetical protein
MSDNDTQLNTAPISTCDITAECPYCDREESFESKPAAWAWLTGHIHTEHSDKLSAFEGVDGDA